jgi:hypothetical protein
VKGKGRSPGGSWALPQRWRQTGGAALLGLRPSLAVGLDGAWVADGGLMSEVKSHGCLRVRMQGVRQAR